MKLYSQIMCKSWIPAIFFTLFVPVAFSQNPAIQQMVNQVNSDNMWNYMTRLTSMQRQSYAIKDSTCRTWLFGFFKQTRDRFGLVPDICNHSYAKRNC